MSQIDGHGSLGRGETTSAGDAQPRDALRHLRSLLQAEGGLIAALVTPPGAGFVAAPAAPADVAAGTVAAPAAPADVAAGTVAAPADTTDVAAASLTAPAKMANVAAASVATPAGAANAREPAGPARIVRAGPRVDGRAADYELLIEAIYEGYLLHYGTPRVVRPPEQDLALLAGDRLYALGLAHLVAIGDIVAVAELADVIALSALAHGAGTPELATAVWTAGALAVGWGPSAPHEQAKALTRSGSPEALSRMQAVAAERR